MKVRRQQQSSGDEDDYDVEDMIPDGTPGYDRRRPCSPKSDDEDSPECIVEPGSFANLFKQRDNLDLRQQMQGSSFGRVGAKVPTTPGKVNMGDDLDEREDLSESSEDMSLPVKSNGQNPFQI